MWAFKNSQFRNSNLAHFLLVCTKIGHNSKSKVVTKIFFDLHLKKSCHRQRRVNCENELGQPLAVDLGRGPAPAQVSCCDCLRIRPSCFSD